MRLLRLSLAVLLISLPLSAATVSSISPSSVYTSNGEWFVTITGTSFLPISNDVVVFTGPAGTVFVSPSVGTDTSITVWVPASVLTHPGLYSVKVRTGRLDSNTVSFQARGNPLSLNLQAILFIEATSLQGAYADFRVSPTDEMSDQITVDCDHKAGELFPFGNTTITCAAGDDLGNSDKGSFTLQVADTTAPMIKTPVDLNAFGAADGAKVVYDVGASDTVDPELKTACTPLSGSLFPVGTSYVTCTSSDRFGNTGKVAFRVHVGTDTAPALTVPESVSAEAASIEGAYVRYAVSGVDIKGNAVDVRCDPASASFFAMGTTSVKCAAGSATEVFNVTVADTTGPLLSLPADFAVDASRPDGEFVRYSVAGKDTVSGATDVSCSPSSGALFAPGQTTVNCSSKDATGNLSSGKFVVTVNPYVDNSLYSITNGDPAAEW